MDTPPCRVIQLTLVAMQYAINGVRFYCAPHIGCCVLCVGQTCTVKIADVQDTYFYSLNTSDGNCSQHKNESTGVFTWNPGERCNFKCAEGYFAANGNEIPFECSDNPDKTSPSGLPTNLIACASA